MLRFSQYLYNSLKYYWRTNLGVIAGASIVTAVLVGALIAGDSVKFSLLKLSIKRLGNTHYALESGQGLFRADLAEEVGIASETITTGVLHLTGSMQLGSSTRLNRIQVYGIDNHFRTFAPSGNFPKGITGNHIALDHKVAELLGLVIGDQVILWIENDIIGSLETVVPTINKREIRFVAEVAAILSDGQLGCFSLKSNQVAPHNVFIDLNHLAEKAGFEGQNNLILCQLAAQTSTEKLNAALANILKHQDFPLETMDLRFEPILQSVIETVAEQRIFKQLFVNLALMTIVFINILIGVLLMRNTKNRYEETNQLLTMGYLPEKIRTLRFLENVILIIVGAVIGSMLGIQFSHVLLYGSASFWQPVVGLSDLYLSINFSRVVLGMSAGIGILVPLIWFMSRKVCRL